MQRTDVPFSETAEIHTSTQRSKTVHNQVSDADDRFSFHCNISMTITSLSSPLNNRPLLAKPSDVPNRALSQSSMTTRRLIAV